MKTAFLVFSVALAGLMTLGCASVTPSNVTSSELPRSLPAESGVWVSWTDPAQFSEISESRNRYDAVRGDWVREIAKSLRTDASRRLPEGDRLDVTITDIKLAGQYKLGTDVRHLQGIHPPRIDLTFKLTGADGTVLAEGTRKLEAAPGYMMSSLRLDRSDPLRYEKRLIGDWQREEIKTAGL